MSFVSVPPTDPPLPILNSAFWPDINPADCREAMRLDGTVNEKRLRAALIEAAASVNVELAAWRQTQQDAGYTTLAGVPADEIDGESVLVQRYRRAVYGFAAANLTERYRSFDATKSGHEQADDLDLTIDDLRRDARNAISDIVGIPRCTVELI